MRNIMVPPSYVAVWEHTNTTDYFENLARKGDLISIPHAYGFAIPEENLFDIQQLYPGAIYVLDDGHNRHQAAVRAGVNLPFTVLECSEDYQSVIDQDSDNRRKSRFSDWEFSHWIQTRRILRILRPELFRRCF